MNQDGQRLRGFEVNTLTVIATESYEAFAQKLQKEIEEDTGIRFGIVEEHQFASIVVTDEEGKVAPLGFDQSKALWEHLKTQGYIDSGGRVQDALKKALKDGTLNVPQAFAGKREQVAQLLKKVAGRLEIKNADERRQVRPRQAVLRSAEFKALWDRIKHKTTYRVEFDNEKLVESCTRALRHAPPIPKTRLQWRKADIAIGKAGVAATERGGAATVVLEESDIELPDLMTDLQDRTQLTRRTIHRVLIDSGRLNDFKINPQQFIELAAEAITRCKRLAIVDGIKYRRLGEEQYYAQEMFENEELTGYLKKLMEAKKAVYEQVVYDSDSEAGFADQLEKNTAIRVYAKLPGWFTVPTPLGGYNPDWAVLVQEEDAERLYFVVETKGTLFTDALRPIEQGKIDCGKVHFKALETGVDFRVANTFEDFSRSFEGVGRPTAVAEEVNKDESSATREAAIQGRLVTPKAADKYRTCVPYLTLKAAAGAFAEGRLVEEMKHAEKWVELPDWKVGEGKFVAQVMGHSMESRINDGDHCLFQLYKGATRQDRIVLAMLRDGSDPESGLSFTVKKYHRVGERIEGQELQDIQIELHSLNPQVPSIQLSVTNESELQLIAWFDQKVILNPS